MQFIVIGVVVIAIVLLELISYIKTYKTTSEKINYFFEDLNYLKKKYITKSEKKELIIKYKKLYKKVKPLNRIFKEFKTVYKKLDKLIDEYNEEFISKELKKYAKFFDELNEYPLDIEQRKAIITDEKSNLIIAGAGSGKTTTIIGKTRYLIEKKKVNPEEIITISFTKMAKENFEQKLNDDRVKCMTFHKLGYEIIEAGKKKLKVIEENEMSKIINNYFKKEIKNNESSMKNYIKYFCYYIHLNEKSLDYSKKIELENGYDFETLKSKYKNLNSKNVINYSNGEFVKNTQELIIANYLFLNGIKYEYNKSYLDNSNLGYFNYKANFYLPDYDLYLEFFDVNKEGKAPQLENIEEQKYISEIKKKREVHKLNGTKLIEVYGFDFYNYGVEEKLRRCLKSHHVKFNEVNQVNMIDLLNQMKQNDEKKSLDSLISTFICKFKEQDLNIKKFDEFINQNKSNKRNYYLLKIIKDVYIYYQNTLKNNNQIDFSDMINMATKIVEAGYNKKLSYIIIDEFQDISYSRYKLIRTLQLQTGAKIIAVGDDWQSIFKFSGSELDFFLNFEKYFGDSKIMFINNTYRNSQELINISSKFVMKNFKGQINKNIKSNKSLKDPIEYVYYDKNKSNALDIAINKLKKINCKNIAILGRNNSDIYKCVQNLASDFAGIDIDTITKRLSEKYNCKIEFMSVHSSKGIEFDGVVLCNMENYIAGFPNKMSEDNILGYVSNLKENYLYEEERRLFYVALTRTKSKCMIMVPMSKASCFATELKEMIEENNGNLIKNVAESYNYLNNPKCPKCKTGNLILRKGGESEFLSCSNYPGCDFSTKYTGILENPKICKKCNSYLVQKVNRKNGNKFYSCLNYPQCNG